MLNKVYVVEVKNKLVDWYPQNVYLSRNSAQEHVNKFKDFIKTNRIVGINTRVKVYVPLKKECV